MMQMIIDALTKEGKRAEGLVNDLAEATQAYKKGRAVRALFHRTEGMAVTLIKHQAEGDASQLEAEMIQASGYLKAHFDRTDILKSQLNGYQSINKYLDTVPNQG